MSFWKKLAKIGLAVAPIAAAPFTGGASLALLGAGTGALAGAMDHGGVKGALLGGALGAIPGVGKLAKGASAAAAAAGAAGAAVPVSAGSKLASVLTNMPKVLSAVGGITSAADKLAHGGQTGATRNAERSAVVGSMADQAAANRLRESQLAQAGPGVDAAALQNIVRSGRIAHYTPPDAEAQALMAKYHRQAPGFDPTTMSAAGTMQQELAKRLASGQPITMSGMTPAGAQEVADNAAARKAALEGPGTMASLTGGLQAGVDATKAGLQFADILKNFRRKRVSTDPNDYTQDPFADQGSK